MKYFLDLEFIEDGRTIDVLSLGIVAEDGRDFYAINQSADRSKANDWVKAHVIQQVDDLTPLTADTYFFSGTAAEIGPEAKKFILAAQGSPKFWGYYADYDWVAFCQLFGSMMNLPKGFPMYCRDIKQLCDMLGNPRLPEQGKGEHHALLDARWNMQAHEFLIDHARTSIHEAAGTSTTLELLAKIFDDVR